MKICRLDNLENGRAYIGTYEIILAYGKVISALFTYLIIYFIQITLVTHGYITTS